MNIYKQMYLMLFNGITEVTEKMQTVQSETLCMEKYLFALRRLQQQSEEMYMECETD